MLPVVAPELLPLAETPQDPEWHPEGDVWTHTLQVIDEAAGLIDDLAGDQPRAITVMLAALCHDLGKASTTKQEYGLIRSPGHETTGGAPSLSPSDLSNAHTLIHSD